MSDLFVEVDEAMKQERLANLWQQYGGFVIGFLAMVILGTAANAGYGSWKTSQNQAQTENFLKVTQDNDDSKTSELSPELLSLVNMTKAGVAIEQNNETNAQEILSNIKTEQSAYKPVQQIADYISISRQENTTDKITAMNKIATDETHPWRFHAYLELAVLEATINQDYTKARSYLAQLIKEENLPQTLKQKAQSLDVLYGLKETI